MKFIHLTNKRNVADIRRNGLRLGGDPIGRGVNCVPLMRIPVKSEVEFKDGLTSYIQSTLVSSSRIWKWLVRTSDAAAVVFEPKAYHWPAELIISTTKPSARSIIQTMQASVHAVTLLELKDDYPDRKDERVELRISAPGARALGWIIKVFLTHDSVGFIDGKANTNFYIIFRKSIPSNCIHEVRALSSTKASKNHKTRRADEDWNQGLEQ
jgi:hypothetical protein